MLPNSLSPMVIIIICSIKYAPVYCKDKWQSAKFSVTHVLSFHSHPQARNDTRYFCTTITVIILKSMGKKTTWILLGEQKFLLFVVAYKYHLPEIHVFSRINIWYKH